MDQKKLRHLPAIDKVLKTREVAALKERFLSRLVDSAVRGVVDSWRERILSGEDPGALDPAVLAAESGELLANRLAPGVVRCINATGVVLHTGLGRAVLPAAALEALQRELTGYSVVSVDREDGARLRRDTAVAAKLAALTGARAASGVNNNAAATVIALNTLAAGREAVLSRGQLVEIGGSFRMPDVFEAAGVKLREVGTTNRTHLRDYEDAIGEDTGLLLRVHPSNYQVVGFTCEPSIDELVDVGRRHNIPVMDDLGAGALVALPPEPEIRDSLAAGTALVTCSGDKLIGGPQSGILLGSRLWIDKVRRNPLFRALRVDKMTLVALEATLRLFLEPDDALAEHPTWAMLHTPSAELARRARTLRRRIRQVAPQFEVELRSGHSQVGSGSLPGEALPTTLLALTHANVAPSALARRLRLGEPPVFTRIVDDQVCLDPRTVRPGEERELVESLQRIE